MTTIIGIDFSGARGDRNTWVAQGQLTAAGELELDCAYPALRHDVFNLLLQLPAPAVAAIDFPFGVPAGFTDFLSSTGTLSLMPQVWSLIGKLDLQDFVLARDAFVDRFGEPKRAGDEKHFSESFSPLHKVNPNMLPMTHQGIRMLHELHEARPGRWIVPPAQSADYTSKDAVTLLETMPGAYLRSIGAIYKGYKTGLNATEKRESILCDLESILGESLPLALRMGCRANDDCLDAVVAAVAAFSWAVNPESFRQPDESELPLAMLEGWIYVPQSAE